MPTASSNSTNPAAAGFRAGLPFVLLAAPFGMLFGVVGTEAGLGIGQVMAFTTLVIAGAAQFTAIQLMTEEAPTLIVLASALAVNLRMAMYSAALQPHLGAAPLKTRLLIAYCNVDQTFAIAATTFEDGTERSVGWKATFFLFSALPLVPTWIAATWLGAVLGASIPEAVALDFALPITFLALIGPALRSIAHVGAAAISVLLALALAWMPFNLGLLGAALGAMATGAELERRGFGR